jgi:Tfp pilus assembly ATPase PilU
MRTLLNAQELFIKANQALDRVISQVKQEQMEQTLPDEMGWRPTRRFEAP